LQDAISYKSLTSRVLLQGSEEMEITVRSGLCGGGPEPAIHVTSDMLLPYFLKHPCILKQSSEELT
jgi:hypothetical protein